MERRDIVRSAVRSAVRSPIRTARSGITDFLSSLPKLLHIEAESPYVLKTGGAEAGYTDGAAFVANQDGDRLPYNGVGYAHMGVSTINRLEVSLPSPWTGYNTLYAEVEIIGSTILSNTSISGLLSIMGNTFVEECFRMTLLSSNRVEFTIKNAAGTRLFLSAIDFTSLIISTDIIKLKLEVDEVNNTRTLSYKINDGAWVVAVTGAYTIDGTFQFNSPKLFIGAVPGTPSPILHFRSCLVKINNVDLVDINIERDATNNAASFVCGTGQTVSVIGSGSSPARIIKATGELKVTGFVQTTAASQPTYLPYDGVGYAHFGSGASNTITTPSTEPLKLLGDFEIEAKLRLSNWTSFADSRCICAKLGGAANRAYRAFVSSLGALQLQISVDGLNTQTFQSSVIVPFTPNQEGYVKFVVDDDNGSSQRVVTFYTSTDGTSWSQLGTPAAQSRVGLMFSDNTSPLEIGNSGSGAAITWMSGAIYYVKMRDGIGGNVIFDCNIDADATDNATSFTSTSGHPMTVNRSGSNPATIIKKARIRADGVDDSLLVAPVMPPMTTKNTIAWHGTVLNLSSQSSHPLTEMKGGGNRFLLRMLQNGSLSAFLHNGTSSATINAPATNPVINGQIFTYICVWDGTSASLYLDGELYYTTTTISVIPNTTPSQASIFAEYVGGNPRALDCMSCIHFPKALTPTEVAKLHTQLING